LLVKILPNEFRGPGRRLQIGRITQHLRAARESGNHQSVPRGNDLIVEMRPRTFAAQLEQSGAAIAH
jgi:hypothetical protein